MFQGVLQIGNFVFEVDDLPEGMPLGGEQMLAVFKFPGGRKEVQQFGYQERNPQWNGVFNYNAIEKIWALDAMWRSGKVYPMNIGSFDTRYGVIKTFEWNYLDDYQIEYSIEIELAPQTSILVPSPSSSTGASSPSTSQASPQRAYVVKSGDTLWKIAVMYYKDGSQYRKIASANKIKNPDLLTVGTKLVIP